MIEWIVSSAVLILAVVLVRQVLKGRISLRLQYALWALILIRLLVPVSFGQSRLSVQNAVAGCEPTQIVEFFAPSEEDTIVSESIQPVQPSQTPSVINPGNAGVPGFAVSPSAEPEQPAAVTAEDVLCTVWFTGIAVVGLWFLFTNLRFWLQLRRSRVKLEAASELSVYVTGAVETPCLFGLLRPAIYLTPGVAEDPAVVHHVLATS